MALRALVISLAFGGFLMVPYTSAQIPLPPGAGTSQAILTLHIRDPGSVLVPNRPYSVVVDLDYQYGPGGMAPPSVQGNETGAGQVCAEVSVPESPPWANVTVVSPIVCFTINPTFAVGGTTVSNSTIVEVNVSEAAPALVPYNVTVRARAPATGTLSEAEGEASRAVAPGFVGRLAVRAPERLLVQGGKPEPVPLTLANLGNGPIEVRFRNFSAPQGLRVVLPERVVLQQPGEERTVFVTLQAPWTTPVKGEVQVQGESSHPARLDLVGDVVRARFEVEGKAAVPGPEAPVAFAAVALAALAAARWRGP